MWEQLSNVQKCTLTSFLESELCVPLLPSKAALGSEIVHEESEVSWKQFLIEVVRDVVARRAERRESLDAHDIIAEVLPIAQSKIPTSTREGLFRLVSTIITPVAHSTE